MSNLQDWARETAPTLTDEQWSSLRAWSQGAMWIEHNLRKWSDDQRRSLRAHVTKVTSGLRGEQRRVLIAIHAFAPSSGPFRWRVDMPQWSGAWNGRYFEVTAMGRAALRAMGAE